MKFAKKRTQCDFKPILKWHYLSISLLFILWFLLVHIVYILNTSFILFCIMACIYIVCIFISFYFTISGYWKILWDMWKSWPEIRHQIISGMCFLGVVFIVVTALVPTLKVAYGKNKFK